MSPDSAPLVTTKQATITASTIAADATQIVAEAPYDGTVSGVSFTPSAAMTGDNTNARTLTLVNRGQTGAGAVVVATLAFTTGVNGVAGDEKPYTLSVVAGATTVVAGDELAAVSTHTGTGIVDPGGLVQVEFTRS